MAGHTLGVVGAGQLGRMLHQAAIGPGVQLVFLAAADDDPAVRVAGAQPLGSATSGDDLAGLAARCDVVTFEHEQVDVPAVRRLEAAGTIVRPSAEVLSIVADKVTMRRVVADAGLPVPPWCQAADLDQVRDAMHRWPRAVLKPSRGGYDGRGVFLVDGVDEAVSIAAPLLLGGAVLLIEPLIEFSMEAATLVARRAGGECVIYDPVRTVQVDGQCREVVAPSGLPARLCERAIELASRLAKALDVVGLLAVEWFVVEGELMVNELAVRPHNTGHHTIDACATSQFENHVRAVLDLPLGSTELRCGATAMVNVIGNAAGDDPGEHLAAAWSVDPEARVHLYGKAARPNRKVGHVTVCDDDPARASARAWAVVSALHGDVPSQVADESGAMP